MVAHGTDAYHVPTAMKPPKDEFLRVYPSLRDAYDCVPKDMYTKWWQ